jgi:hypothetical protein
MQITYQTKKSMKFGVSRTVLPIEVKGGPKYQLELKANITIPEITLETNSGDCVDFENVLIG